MPVSKTFTKHFYYIILFDQGTNLNENDFKMHDNYMKKKMIITFIIMLSILLILPFILTKTAKPQLSELQQSVYTAAEFAAMHDKFGTTADMVKTALKMAKKDRCTYAEAEKIIKKFLS